jgi:hypothetical protein
MWARERFVYEHGLYKKRTMSNGDLLLLLQ